MESDLAYYKHGLGVGVYRKILTEEGVGVRVTRQIIIFSMYSSALL
jgi:hypothetical protein